MNVIYLDNNATTRPAPQVVAAMMPYFEELYGNASSVHRFGLAARHALDEARAKTASFLGCRDSEISFTGGGTESVNTAIRGLLAARAPRKKIVTSSVEHSATRELCQQLAREGVSVTFVPVDVDGNLDLDQFRAAVDDQTALVTMMSANNETGVMMPMDEIADICTKMRVPLHCDATQTIGKMPFNFHDARVDAASCAPHKFHGPKGVGVLYARRGVRIGPLLVGGPQELGRRGGTENVPGIVGTGVACDLAKASLPEMAGRVKALRDRFERSILESIPETRINGNVDRRVPNTTNVGFRRLEAEAILLLLSEQGVCASAGSACSSGSLEPSPILQAMGIDPQYAHGALRFSLSKFTTDAEIDRALEALPKVIDRLRAVLPVA